ncbi:MAG: protein BatD [Paludibacteraceae bacterium]|nr:protein BatD [Paludibacteraceae bacterium]
MYKKLFIVLSFISIALSAVADDVVFKAQAPKQVILGKPFQVTYTVNQRSRDLQAPEFTNFDVLSGPYTSTSSSTSFINGKRTSVFEQSYTYMLMAQRTGTYTIPPATVRVNGETVQSNGVRIEVLPADEQPANSSSRQSNTPNSSNQPGSQSPSGQSAQSAQTNSENIFVRTIASKTHVHEQEALMITYKLYFANVDVAQLTNNTKLPEFTGFLKHELEQGEIQTELEHYNGRNYQTAVLYRTILYPQHSGEIKIEPAKFEAILRVQTRTQSRSIFDDFFGSYTNVTKMITAPGVTIKVDGLPGGKPAGFSGGVGKFTLTPSISQTELQTNDAVTIKLDISGTGNMKLLKTPAIDWPEGFEPYDPKVTNNFSTTTAGVSGTKSIEYLAIPRNAGDYTIPPVTFSYFDIEEKTYKTLTTPEYTIHVKRAHGESANSNDANGYVSYPQKEDIKQLGTDIRYIDVNGEGLKAKGKGLIEYGSWAFWLCYLIPLLIAIVLLIVLRKQIKENADITRVRYKHANKVAQKRLKAAAAALKANDKDTFYAEIERAAWTYLSDRLSIPTADLNKENIASILSQKGVSDNLIEDVKNVLSTAEFARYAPSTDHAMNDLYKATTNLINNLEDQKI